MTVRILTLIAAGVAVTVGALAVPAGLPTVTGQEADSRTVALEPEWNQSAGPVQRRPWKRRWRLSAILSSRHRCCSAA